MVVSDHGVGSYRWFLAVMVVGHRLGQMLVTEIVTTVVIVVVEVVVLLGGGVDIKTNTFTKLLKRIAFTFLKNEIHYNYKIKQSAHH